MASTWMEAMERARAASDKAGYTAEMAARARYRYTVDFTISRELVDLVALDAAPAAEGVRVHLVFDGTDDARRRVCDVIAQLPSVHRTYRMSYEPGREVVPDGEVQAEEALGQA